MTTRTRITALLLAALLLLPVLCACGKSQTGYNPLSGVETTFITDSCGRKVEVPAEITRIAPSGPIFRRSCGTACCLRRRAASPARSSFLGTLPVCWIRSFCVRLET